MCTVCSNHGRREFDRGNGAQGKFRPYVDRQCASSRGDGYRERIGRDLLQVFGCRTSADDRGRLHRQSVKLSCGKRARAIRNEMGAFDVVQPQQLAMTQPTSLQPGPELTTPGAAAVASHMAIFSTPSPVANILLLLEAQASDQHLPPVPARIQHFEQLQQQAQPLQPLQQQQQQQTPQHQEEDDIVAERLRQIVVGKRRVEREQTPDTDIRPTETKRFVNTLLEQVSYLEGPVRNRTKC